MFLASALLSAMIALTPQTAAQPRITIDQGVLVGRRRDGVDSYKAIPFAAPPVGDLRWKPPHPAPSWTEERDAGQVGAICIQPPANGDPGVGPLPMSEDCLTLNVWAPEQSEAPLPVMVWIHGGGLNNGSGTAALYDGSALARRGVVVVTVNYRLGRLGFFDHPALAAGREPGEAAGNYGLMDVIAALRWVKANIAAVGGDPGRVTVFGESAGGLLVTRLMIAEPARGLFQGAIVQSGLGREQGVPLDRPGIDGSPSAQDRGVAYTQALGLGADATAAQLRAIPAERLLTPGPSFFGADLLLIDGQIVTEDVEPAFAAGRQAPVPLIIGTNSAEFWWIKPSDLTPYGAVDDGLTADERTDLVQAYGGQAGYDAEVVSDMVFTEPARHVARLHTAAGHPAWLYRFDVVPDPNPEPQHPGATHASERPYVFDNVPPTMWTRPEIGQAVADSMAGYWTTFARSGDPNHGTAVGWPIATVRETELLEFTNGGPVSRPVPHPERLDRIEAFFTRTR